jgi:hypothetical protein
MIHFDQTKDGTWRVIWNPDLVHDLTNIVNFEILRGDD